MSTPTLPPIKTDPRAGLLPGALNRGLLAEAVTFALTSLRNAVREYDGWSEEWFSRPGFVHLPGVEDPLAWVQDTWTTSGIQRGQSCGTGCCIAGWIDIAGDPFTDHVPSYLYGGASDRAIYLLTGGAGGDGSWRVARDKFPGLPDGVYQSDVQDVFEELFAASNGIQEVIARADELLELYGQEPLRIDPTGVFS